MLPVEAWVSSVWDYPNVPVVLAASLRWCLRIHSLQGKLIVDQAAVQLSDLNAGVTKCSALDLPETQYSKLGVGVSLSSCSWPRVHFWIFLHKKGDCFSHKWQSRQNIHAKLDCVVSKYHSSYFFMPLISRIALNTWHSRVHTLKPFKNVKNLFCSSCPVMVNIVMVSLFFLFYCRL